MLLFTVLLIYLHTMAATTLTREVIESIFDQKLKPLNAKIDSVIESISFWESQFEEIHKRIDAMEDSSGQLVKKNKLLKDEVMRLSNSLNVQKESMNELQQYVRWECLEIAGIPEEAAENTNDIVIKVGDLMGINIESSDISISHRLSVKPSYTNAVKRGRGSGGSKIIVKFVRRDIRDKFYKSRKYPKDKTTRYLGMVRHPDNRIYINESLSPNNKYLFQECLKIKREKNFKFIWTQYGRIYVRKDANSPAKTVANQKDLELVRRSAAS